MELSRQLRIASGKKQYGYLKPAVKSLVDEIVDKLEQDERVAAAYDLWYEMREDVLQTYKDELPERISLSQQNSIEGKLQRADFSARGEVCSYGDMGSVS